MILLVGPPGVGKTTLAAQFTVGHSYWIIDPKESGIIDLMESRAISIDRSMIHPFITDFPQLTYLLAQIKANPSTIPQNAWTIVIESVSGFELMAREHCCKTNYKNDWSERGFMNYQNGYKETANAHWSPFITQLCNLREMGFNIILTGHSTIVKQKNQSGVDYLTEACDCHEKVWKATHQFFENLFFLSYDVSTERGDKKDNIAMGIGKAKGYTKMLYVNATPYQNAKNKFGAPVPDIEADCSAQQLYMKLCQAARWNPLTLRY